MSILVSVTEVEFSAIRAQGPGGQHVNTSSTAAHLRFDIVKSSLPDDVKSRLLACSDSRISSDGVLIIKAQGSRSLAANKIEAMARLHAFIEGVTFVPKPRRLTKPTKASRVRRLETKSIRSVVKGGRAKVSI